MRIGAVRSGCHDRLERHVGVRPSPQKLDDEFVGNRLFRHARPKGLESGQERGLRARDYAEWMPFIDGYVYTGRYDTVRGIIPIVKEYPSLKQQVCNQLANPAQSSYASFSQESIDFLTSQLCN